ncbi:MAG: hypothetical protein JST81_00820 [Bacteroidetes bacterium]|jgi:hypothetical protein|nr:hypothetical protein [Bacteroidota bacterium]
MKNIASTNSFLPGKNETGSFATFESVNMHAAQVNLFREIKNYILSNDRETAFELLPLILSRPGMESWCTRDAHAFLQNLFCYTEQFFDLYGMSTVMGKPVASLCQY